MRPLAPRVEFDGGWVVNGSKTFNTHGSVGDVGAAIVMRHDGETVRRVLNAQVGKAGPPMDGKDLHLGDWDRGILPPAAPLSISVMTMTGVAYSQNTEPWFYRTPGLKIVAPSTPADARALLATAVADPDPVLYYEHIALYREPKIKEVLGDGPPAPIELGKSALREGAKFDDTKWLPPLERSLSILSSLASDDLARLPGRLRPPRWSQTKTGAGKGDRLMEHLLKAPPRREPDHLNGKEAS